jgi:hypothetical protein
MTMGYTREVWAGDEGGALVDFDENKRVVYTYWTSAREPFFDRILEWLRSW